MLATAAAWQQRVPLDRREDAGWQPLLLRLQLEQDLLAEPTNARRQLQLGLFWAQRRDLQRAEPLLRAAAAALPDDVDSQRAWAVWLGQQGRYAEAATVASQASVATALRQEARLLSAVATTRQQLLQSAENGVSIDAAALRELALSEFAAERFDRAAAALAQPLRQQPADRDAIHLLGEMQVRSKLRVVAERLTPRHVHVDGGRRISEAAAP
jgi:Tfp pilus assembly protein PilF